MNYSLHAALKQFNSTASYSEAQLQRYVCRYWEIGEGPALILIHGMNDQARSFAPMMVRLAKNFRCVAYELPTGSGDGARIQRYQHSDYVEDLFELCNKLQLANPLIFGCSFGSTITLAAAARDSSRFKSIMIQGGFARRPLITAEKRLASLAQFLPGRMRHVPGRVRMMKEVDGKSFIDYPPEIWDFYLENAGVTPIRAVAKRGLLLGKLDLRPELEKIKIPLLMIGGDRDEMVPKMYEEEVLQGVPGSKRIEFAPCGHFPQYVRPEETTNAVLEFVG
jgi:pimeloyl-ACP methyl ester carboxylesterase